MKYYLLFLLIFSLTAVISCKSTKQNKSTPSYKMDAASIKFLKQAEKENSDEPIDIVIQYHNPVTNEQIQAIQEMGVDVITTINTFVAARASINLIKKINELEEVKSIEIGKAKTK